MNIGYALLPALRLQQGRCGVPGRALDQRVDKPGQQGGVVGGHVDQVR